MSNRHTKQTPAAEPAYSISDDDRRYIEKIMEAAAARGKDPQGAFAEFMQRLEPAMILRRTIAPETFDSRSYFRACLRHAIEADERLDPSRPPVLDDLYPDSFDLDSDIPY